MDSSQRRRHAAKGEGFTASERYAASQKAIGQIEGAAKAAAAAAAVWTAITADDIRQKVKVSQHPKVTRPP